MANRKHSRVDTSKLRQILRETGANIDDLLMGAGIEMNADIVLLFNTSPPGEAYTRGGVTHIASQPGYPPNIDTAALMGSMHVEKDGPGRVIIADGVEYGILLEEGTENMSPRPFIGPVFEEWRRGKFARYIIAQGIVKV
jgi:hypothetical protein